MEKKTKISELIAPVYYQEHLDIKAHKYTHYWNAGGRSSAKSAFISLEIVQGIVNNPKMHAVCFRKYSINLRESLFNQMLWAVDMLGLNNYFSATLAPMELTYKPTGQKILFRGLDDPRKTKSIKPVFGWFGFIWFEELDQYDGMEEIRSVLQSLMRGGDCFTCLYSYNPPQTLNNWVNNESLRPVDNRKVYKTTYLDIPKEWIGQEFFIEAELLKKNNELAYRHEYLGEITGTGGAVFTNLVCREITDEEIKHFPDFQYGTDWGFATDPFAWGKQYFDKTRRTLYIIDEVYKTGLLNTEAMAILKTKDIGRGLIIADSAEPKSIEEFRRNGFNIRGAEKGKDSVRYGIKWLQDLCAIVIDPKRTPNAWREFSTYEYEKGRDGQFKSEYPDKNNHFLDQCRYSCERFIIKRGLF